MLATLLLLAIAPQDDAALLEFAPPEGQPVTMERTLELALELTESETVLTCEHGDDVEFEDRTARWGDSYRLRSIARVVDRHEALHAGLAERFRRRYETLGLQASHEGRRDFDVELESAIAGREVLFEWQADDEAYRRALLGEEDRSARDLLPGLAADLPLAGWLPPESARGEPLEVGDGWRIEARELLRSLWPGGFADFGYADRGRELLGDEWRMFDAWVPEPPPRPRSWWEVHDDAVSARLARLEPGTAGPVAVIELELDLAGERDAREAVLLATGGQPFRHPSSGMEGDLAWTIRGRGELRWLVRQGHLESARIDAEVELVSDLAWSFDWDVPRWERFDFERFERWTGELRFRTAVVEPDTTAPTREGGAR